MQPCQKNAGKSNAYIFIIPQNVVAEKTNHKKKHGKETDRGGMKRCAQRGGALNGLMKEQGGRQSSKGSTFYLSFDRRLWYNTFRLSDRHGMSGSQILVLQGGNG